MKLEKYCSAVLYTMKYGEPSFLVERDYSGTVVVPRVDLYAKGNDAGSDRAVITGKISLAVSLDTVFHHDTWHDGIVYAAEVSPEEKTDWDTEDLRLEWINWLWAASRVKDETDQELMKHAISYLAVKLGLRNNPIKEFGYIWYREHAADIHSHIIPGADDGAQTKEETMELLRLDREEGIQWVFATPHYGEENGYAPTRA